MKSSTARAALCTDGRIHYESWVLIGNDEASVIRFADNQVARPGCGGQPHYLAEQVTTVSDWKRIEVGE